MSECSICLETIEKSELKELECKHKFHKSCLKKWEKNLENGHKCPYCRKEYKEPSNIYESYIEGFLIDEPCIYYEDEEICEDMFGLHSMSDEDFEVYVRFFELRPNT